MGLIYGVWTPHENNLYMGFINPVFATSVKDVFCWYEALILVPKSVSFTEGFSRRLRTDAVRGGVGVFTLGVSSN